MGWRKNNVFCEKMARVGAKIGRKCVFPPKKYSIQEMEGKVNVTDYAPVSEF